MRAMRSWPAATLLLCYLIHLSGCGSTRSYLDEVRYEATARPGTVLDPRDVGIAFCFAIPSENVEWMADVTQEPSNLYFAERVAAVADGFRSAGFNLPGPDALPRYWVTVLAVHTPFTYRYDRPISSHSFANAFDWQTGTTVTASGTSTTYVPESVELMRATLVITVYDFAEYVDTKGTAPQLWRGLAGHTGLYDPTTLREDLEVLLSHWGTSLGAEWRPR